MGGESGGREENDEGDDDDGSSVNAFGVVDCVANKEHHAPCHRVAMAEC